MMQAADASRSSWTVTVKAVPELRKYLVVSSFLPFFVLWVPEYQISGYLVDTFIIR